MPRVSLWFIRTALLNLGLGFTLGALMLWNKAWPIQPGIVVLLPLHQELLLVGWTIQLVMGVALWIFPRFGVPSGQARKDTAAWAAFILLNVGVWLAGLAALVSNGDILVFVGRLAELGSAASFAWGIWPRVRASGLSTM